MFKFEIVSKNKKSKARVGGITTAHGVIDTPTFVPVGTQATVKSLTPQDLKEIGVQIFFGNTYHLHLRPGEDIIKKFGGLGEFMGWDGVTMTDSGGFQVFSLAKSNARGPAANRSALRSPRQFGDSSNPNVNQSSSVARAKFSKVGSKDELFKSSPHAEAPRASTDEDDGVSALVKITDDGVVFRSHLDGSLHNFTPEKSIEIQQKLGADIILAFDECAPYPSSYEYTKKAMERTHAWAKRCLDYYSTSEESFHNTSEVTEGLLRGGRKQALYGIIQGGVYKDLREESAKFIANLDFDGIAIGGVAVGESKKEMRDVLDWTVPLLPDDKPRHLLGVGEIDDIFEIIERGIDTFDCVIPTRLGRTGFVFVSPPEGNIKNRFRVDINKSLFAKDKTPPSKDCKCYICENFTRAYIHHLFNVKELLSYRLATYHNLYFITNLVKEIREAILEGRFKELKKDWI